MEKEGDHYTFILEGMSPGVARILAENLDDL